jgi:hypothetical protein
MDVHDSISRASFMGTVVAVDRNRGKVLWLLRRAPRLSALHHIVCDALQIVHALLGGELQKFGTREVAKPLVVGHDLKATSRACRASRASPAFGPAVRDCER